MKSKNETQYVGIGLIFGAAIGSIIGIFTSQLALFTAIGAGLGLTVGSILTMYLSD
jgi:ABC-type lipoprotein release transport system permease subunit